VSNFSKSKVSLEIEINTFEIKLSMFFGKFLSLVKNGYWPNPRFFNNKGLLLSFLIKFCKVLSIFFLNPRREFVCTTMVSIFFSEFSVSVDENVMIPDFV